MPGGGLVGYLQGGIDHGLWQSNETQGSADSLGDLSGPHWARGLVRAAVLWHRCLPPDASPALIAFIRIFAGPCLGIAALNWMARSTEPSPARDAIVLANIVGFGCVTAVDVWGVVSGDARELARVFLAIHLLFTLAFVMAGRAIRKSA
jgi:hypothetical protein